MPCYIHQCSIRLAAIGPLTSRIVQGSTLAIRMPSTNKMTTHCLQHFMFHDGATRGLAGWAVLLAMIEIMLQDKIDEQQWQVETIRALFDSLADIGATYEVVGEGSDIEMKARLPMSVRMHLHVQRSMTWSNRTPCVCFIQVMVHIAPLLCRQQRRLGKIKMPKQPRSAACSGQRWRSRVVATRSKSAAAIPPKQ